MSVRATQFLEDQEIVSERRSRDRASKYLFVRSVMGKTGIFVWQARPWLAMPVGSVNLGLFREERAAWEAVRLWLKAGGDPCRGLPEGVLPKWVRKVDGVYRAVLRTRGGDRLVLPGEYLTAEAAHLAARAEVERRIQERRRKSVVIPWSKTAAVRRYYQRSLFEAWEG